MGVRVGYGRLSDWTRGDDDTTSAKEARARTRPSRWSTSPPGPRRDSRGHRAGCGTGSGPRPARFRACPGPRTGSNPARSPGAFTGAASRAAGGATHADAGTHRGGSRPGPATDGRTEGGETTAPPPPRPAPRVPPADIRPLAPADAQRGPDARLPSRPSSRPRTAARRRRVTRAPDPDAPRARPMKRAILIAALAAASLHRRGAASRLEPIDRRAARPRRSTCSGWYRDAVTLAGLSPAPPISTGLRASIDVHAGTAHPRTCLVR